MTRRLAMLWAAVTMLAVACGSGDPITATDPDAADGGGAEDGEVTIGLSVSTLQNPFFVTLEEGATGAAQDAGVELLVADAQDDAATQANDLQDFITQGVDVVLLNPTDSAAVGGSVEALNDAGIPVITVDRTADTGDVVAHIGSDNVEAGRLAGEALVEAVGGEGQVIVLEGVPATDATRLRAEGFAEVTEANADIEVAASQTANFDRSEGLSVTENLLESNSDVVGVYAHNDEMALGAVEAARSAGVLEELAIVGIDAVDDAVAAVEAGEMTATIAQQPAQIGELGVATAVQVANGEEVEADQPVEVVLVTQDNIGEFQE